MTEHLSGGDMLIRALQDEGVDYIFGYPGGAALHIYDAIFRQQRVEHILVRHEQAATHMADGYARATGRPGVVLVTSGPGATNAITGIATAYMDSIPMVVISGQVPTDLIGTDAFQETDMVGVSRPVVKHSFLVSSAADIPMVVKKAFYIATSGRPGPVVIDVPKDTTDPSITAPYKYPKSVTLRSYNPATRGHTGQIRRAVEALARAKRPVIYAGGGVVQGNAGDLLTRIARRLNFPVTTTLMGLGAFPASDRQCLGMLGMHGTFEANNAMHAADLILAIGARFDDRVTNNRRSSARRRTIVHVDVDPASISKIIPADIPIVGPALAVLEEMEPMLEQELTKHDLPDRAALQEWWKQIDAWRATHGLNHHMLERVDRRCEDPAAAGSAGVAQGNEWRCVRHERRRPAPDVRGAVLHVRRAAPLDQLRRTRHDGFRPAGRDGRAVRIPARDGRVRHRRRQLHDEHAGAVHLPAVRSADQDRSTSTTPRSAWSSSGRTCSTADATRTARIATRCRIS